MKDFEWRTVYAPHGYHYMKRRIGFETLERFDDARFVAYAVSTAIEEMLVRISKECPYFYQPSLAQTRLSVYPKDIGEDLNHLDPLKPRLGIEIEIRQPLPADIRQ